jgi:hypothetical protein
MVTWTLPCFPRLVNSVIVFLCSWCRIGKVDGEEGVLELGDEAHRFRPDLGIYREGGDT